MSSNASPTPVCIPLGSPQIQVSPLNRSGGRTGKPASNGIALTKQQYPIINMLPFATLTNGTTSNIYTALWAKPLNQRMRNYNNHKMKQRRKQNIQKGFKPPKYVTRSCPYIPSGVPRQSLSHFRHDSNKLGYLVSNHIILQAKWKEEWSAERQDREGRDSKLEGSLTRQSNHWIH